MATFGLVGRSLAHSFSARYFTDRFKTLQLDHQYLNFELNEVSELPNLFTADGDLIGVNVTIPYKKSVLSVLDQQSPAVEAIGACNTIKKVNGELIGFNTDWIGFKQSIQPLLLSSDRRALILGTGGAAKAIAFALRSLDIEYLFVSRRDDRHAIKWQNLSNSIIESHSIVINCTPVGTHPNLEEMPPFPMEHVNEDHLVYDLVYNPKRSKFLDEAQLRGARIKNGYEMLVRQAEASWHIWNSPKASYSSS